MKTIGTIALLALLGIASAACTNYATTATLEAAKAWEKSLPPSNGNGNGSIKHVSSTPIDCPEVDPAQKSCSSGSGWTY